MDQKKSKQSNSCWRVFLLLMWKNFLVRKRNWITAIMSVIVILLVFLYVIHKNWEAVLECEIPIIERENQNEYQTIIIGNDGKLDASFYSYPTVFYAPKTNATQKIIKLVEGCMHLQKEMKGFETEQKALEAFQNHSERDIAIIIFASDPESKKFDYTIRTSGQLPGYFDRRYFEYQPSYRHLIGLKNCLNMEFIRRQSQHNISTNIYAQRMPVGLKKNDYVEVFFVLIALLFYFPINYESAFVHKEKILGVNVLMAMNGVKTQMNLFSWLISGLLTSIIYTKLAVIVFSITLFRTKPFLEHSDVFLAWIVFTLNVAYNLACVIHLASYFSRPVLSKLFIMAFFAFSFAIKPIILAISTVGSIRNLPFFGIFFPNILLMRFLDEVFTYRRQSIGLHWNNLFNVADSFYNVTGSAGMVMIFLIIGTALHFWMAVYIHAVKPGKFGAKKNLLYFLEPLIFWRESNQGSTEVPEVHFDSEKSFEPAPPSAVPGISIRNLTKTYRTSLFDKSAYVDALKSTSLDLYQGQITALLGQNGAGKTTMMSILTGMTSPTTGDVFINGKDFSKEFDTIISDIGFCPQEDICFPELTVSEQLLFFGLLKRKDKSKKEVGDDVNDLLKKLNLHAKKNDLQSKLSGGQKRRLCLGMALISEASIVILDEPTSGLDPENRRNIWDIVLDVRKKKTILISTHSMDEADILGDRIAIINSGNLKCYGTPMFLKKSYGQGKMEITCSTTPACDPKKVQSLLGKNAETTSFENCRLKLAVSHSDTLPDRLDELELEKKNLGITGISVSAFSLEQVFIKVVEEENKVEPEGHRKKIPTYKKLTGCKLTLQRISALIKKKFIFHLKHPSSFIISLLLIILGWFLVRGITTNTESKLPISLSLYEDAQTFNTKNVLGSEFSRNYPSIVNKRLGYQNPENSSKTQLMKDLKKMAQEHGSDYLYYAIAGADFEKSGENLAATAFYSRDATYSFPISLDLLYNAILKTLAGNEFEITSSLDPLPTTTSVFSKNVLVFALIQALRLCAFVFPVVALFVIHPLRENLSEMKSLQIMTGMSSVTYWAVMFVCDLAIFFVFSWLFIVSFGVQFDLSSYYDGYEMFLMLVILLLFAANTMPIMYILSFCKNLGSIISHMYIWPLLIVVLQEVLLLIIQSEYPNSYETERKLVIWFFYLVPHVTFFRANKQFILTVSSNWQCKDLQLPEEMLSYSMDTCKWQCEGETCKGIPKSFFGNFEEGSLEQCLVVLAVTSILYFAILFIIEEKLVQKMIAKMRKNSKPNMDHVDEQVKAEKVEVAKEINLLNQQNLPVHFPSNKSMFLVYELRKRFGKVQAVKDISFKINPKECFGLLGVNGAGKSTTFKMLGGQVVPDHGSLFLNGSSMKNQKNEYLSQLGYCPQNSVLIETLNAKDHLRLFARLRGVPEKFVEDEIRNWIFDLGLQKHVKKQTGTYSGGNKRRLIFAMSMIGKPEVVLLDEPTTGVDPSSRKLLWKVIDASQKNGQSIILTSHSMEECEALCNRLGIIVNGQFVCLGQSEQLKQNFGVGFDVQLKLRHDRQPNILNLKTEIVEKLNWEITYEYTSLLTCHVSGKLSWRFMYNSLNDLKQKYDVIEDYTVLSSTLEQLFLQFARAAKVPNRFLTIDA